MSKTDSYKTFMRLVIHKLDTPDFTTYRCIAKNSLGETDGSIKLYEIIHKGSGGGSGEEGPGYVEGIEGSGSHLDTDLTNPQDPDGLNGDFHEGQFIAKVDRARDSKRTKYRGPNLRKSSDGTNEVYDNVDQRFEEKHDRSKSHLGSGGEGSDLDLPFNPFGSGESSNHHGISLFFICLYAQLVWIIL
ncbi:unnamed protein product [Meganyctiphanes norvegica]|uniref:Immunoglobulin I-set domain-containing protein n=1 Tax=Meganyctiphanes norvegica TaxID=48144 RepID=A0AAV2QK27_MEGNR